MWHMRHRANMSFQFFTHTHMQSIHVNITSVSRSVIFPLCSMQGPSQFSAALAFHQESLVIPRYLLEFFLVFLSGKLCSDFHWNVKKKSNFYKAQRLIRVRYSMVRLYTQWTSTYTHFQIAHKHISAYTTQECVGSSVILTKGSDVCRLNGEPSVNVFFCFFWLWYGPVESNSLH